MRLKPRSIFSHKGQNGTVLVIGGSEDYIGAPALVGMAALRSGADLAYIAAPEKVAWAINRLSPDLITRKMPGTRWSSRHLPSLKALAKRADAIVIGNGMDLAPATKTLIRSFARWASSQGMRLIIDATALRAVRITDCPDAIFTPHAGELKALLRTSQKSIDGAQRALKKGIIVQKGHPRTILRTRNAARAVIAGHPGMTHGGTGDVLAGIIAALWAAGNPASTASEIAIKANGQAARWLGRNLGFGYIASDLIKALPAALKQHWRVRRNA